MKEEFWIEMRWKDGWTRLPGLWRSEIDAQKAISEWCRMYGRPVTDADPFRVIAVGATEDKKNV
jgi:hypothetical protein